jgi:hypothetical protein
MIESKIYKVYEEDKYFALRAHRLVYLTIVSRYNSLTAEELFEKIHIFRMKILFM